MAISFRSALTAGVVAFGTSTVLFTSTVTPIPDTPVAHGGSTVTSHLTVDLRAATQRSIQTRELSAISLLASAQLLGSEQTLADGAVTPTIAPYPGLIALSDWIRDIYGPIEDWVRYGFEVAAAIVGWIPYGWIFDDQIMVFYNFFENLVHSGVWNTTDWLSGRGSALKNVADWGVDFGLALWQLAIDEIGAWIPLPPIDIYPPPIPYADLPEGVIGDVVVGASNALARVSHGIWNIWEPIELGIDGLVGLTSNFLQSIAWIPFVPLIDFELVAGWDLIASGVDAVVGFAHDMITAGDQFVIDTFHGGGLVAATVNATQATLASAGTRGGDAIQAWVDWGRAQIDYFVDRFTPGAAGASTEVLATATDANEGGLAAMARAFTLGNLGLAPYSAHKDALAKSATLDEQTTDMTDETTTSDDHVQAVGKTVAEALGKVSKDLTKGLRKGTLKAAIGAGNGNPGKPGADIKKLADKLGANTKKLADKLGADTKKSADRLGAATKKFADKLGAEKLNKKTAAKAVDE